MKYDFIVVGAGIAGTSVAFELARFSRVCLVEGEPRPGLHATGRSAALFAPSYGGREIRALTRASRDFFERPPPGFSDYPLLRQRGCLYVARQDQCDRLRRMVHDIRDSGGEVVLLDEAAARARVPLLRSGCVALAALDSDAMDIDVNELQQGFLKGARAAGTRLEIGHWMRSARRRNGSWLIDLAEGTATAPVLINAAGAWADEVAGTCGADPVGLRPLRRTALLVDAPDGIDIRQWPAVIDADEQFYFRPEAGQLLLSPADEIPDRPGDAQPDELQIAIGVDRVEAVLDIEVRRVRRSWAGLRTFSPDRTPVLGFDPRVSGLFWCAGQGGYGIQTAPAMARAAAALAKQENLPADVVAEGLAPDDLSPHRFLDAAGIRKRQVDAGPRLEP